MTPAPEILRREALRGAALSRVTRAWAAWHGLTEADVARKLGVSRGYLNAAFNGTGTLSPPRLEQLTELIGWAPPRAK